MELFQITKTFQDIYDREGLEAAGSYYDQVMIQLSTTEFFLVESHFSKEELDYTGMFSRLRYAEVYLGYSLGMRTV